MANEVNLNRLAVFVALVRAGSFTAAAEQLGLTKAMVSQHLARLEQELGATLLLRSTRRALCSWDLVLPQEHFSMDAISP